MSIASISSKCDGLRKSLEQIQRDLANASSTERQAVIRLQQAEKSARSASPSFLKSKLADVDRASQASHSARTKVSELQTKASTKQVELLKSEAELAKEHQREQEKLSAERKRQETEFKKTLASLQRPPSAVQFIGVPAIRQSIAPEQKKSFDFFISHASEDKPDVASPLYEALTRRGLEVWFDKAELQVGDSLRRKIDQGLSASTFGVVILSASFFAKEWPQKELDGLFARETAASEDDPPVILPIWHRVTKDEVARFSPMLASKLALTTTTQTIEEIAELLSKRVA